MKSKIKIFGILLLSFSLSACDRDEMRRAVLKYMPSQVAKILKIPNPKPTESQSAAALATLPANTPAAPTTQASPGSAPSPTPSISGAELETLQKASVQVSTDMKALKAKLQDPAASSSFFSDRMHEVVSHIYGTAPSAVQEAELKRLLASTDDRGKMMELYNKTVTSAAYKKLELGGPAHVKSLDFYAEMLAFLEGNNKPTLDQEKLQAQYNKEYAATPFFALKRMLAGRLVLDINKLAPKRFDLASWYVGTTTLLNTYGVCLDNTDEAQRRAWAMQVTPVERLTIKIVLRVHCIMNALDKD